MLRVNSRSIKLFIVRNQREWEALVKRGLGGEVWCLEVAAETVLDVVKDVRTLSEEGITFLKHLLWLAENCHKILSWISFPSCERILREFRKFEIDLKPERANLPIDDIALLKRMHNAIPVAWAEV